MRDARPTGPGATCSTSAAAPASTCRASPATRARGDRRRAAPRPASRSPAGVPARCANVTRARRAPRRRSRCPTRRSTWCTRGGPTSSARAASPGCAELDRVVRRGGTAFVIDNDADAGRRSAAGSGAATRRSTPVEVERFWSDARLDTARRSTSAGASTPRADLEAVVRIEFAARGRRGGAGRARRAPRSTTRSTCGGARC